MRCRAQCLTRLPGLVVLLSVSALGCGGGDRMPKTHPLKGKVVYKGGRPVSGGSIAFECTIGAALWRAGSGLGPDGSFDNVITLRPDGKEAKGLVEGEHRVRIDLGRGGDPGEGGPRVRVRARYTSFEKSGLTVRVPAPNDQVVFELDPP